MSRSGEGEIAIKHSLRELKTIVASLHLYCMYGYTVTVYYTCTVDSRMDPRFRTVFFSFRFHASTHHCRCYCLFLAANYKNTLPTSFQPASFRPSSSFTALVLLPTVHKDHTICSVNVNSHSYIIDRTCCLHSFRK